MLLARWFLFILIVIFVSCGKVTQDISSQSEKSILETANYSINLSDFKKDSWQNLVSSKDVSIVYSYLQGVRLGAGLEKISWASAEIMTKVEPSQNVVTVKNFDTKKNVVTSSRYQQGLFSVNKVSTLNYKLKTVFRNIRPKYEYYSSIHYTNKDSVIMMVSETVPKTEVEVTPYLHLVSMVFMKHLEKESYNAGTIIPLSLFKQIIPTMSVVEQLISSANNLASASSIDSSTQNVNEISVAIPEKDLYPSNNVKKFDKYRPKVIVDNKFYESLLGTVSLVKHSDEVDTLDYISEQEDGIFSEQFKLLLSKSVKDYFKVSTQNARTATVNATTTANATEN